MPLTRRLAVSYSRFSDPKQAAGDSTDRQQRDYRAFRERHNLTPGKEVFADRGRSGYRGEHRTKGKLGQLIEAAKDGRFESGTVVVIEAWDRLGRLRPDRQTELVAELLGTGVSIDVCRLNDIFIEDDFGTHKWTTLAVFIQLAHQESKQKAERVGASWARRRQRAREEGAMAASSFTVRSPRTAARATWAWNAAVWTFRWVAIGTTSEGRQSSLTGGPVFGIHYRGWPMRADPIPPTGCGTVPRRTASVARRTTWHRTG